MLFSDLLLCNNGVKQLFEPLYWNLKKININIRIADFQYNKCFSWKTIL